MAVKSFRPRFVVIPAILAFSLFMSVPAFAQEVDDDDVGAQLFRKFKDESKKPCGQRDEAVRIGKKLIADYADDENNTETIAYLKQQVPKLEKEDAVCKNEDSLENLFHKFKTARSQPCGKRAAAVRIGKRILELYANDPENQEVIKYVRDQTARMEKDDESCNKPDLPFMPKPQSRIELMARGKELIASEGSDPLVLDVILTTVSTGYDIIVIDKNDAFNNDTITYARLAIQKIEAGQTSSTGKWGVFAPFKTKENALSWMNYIAGYILADRQNKKEEALPYFYKAAQVESDLGKDGQIYQTIGRYYLDRLFNAPPTESAESKALAERALIAYAKAYRLTLGKTEKKALTGELYSKIERLYRFRFKVPAGKGSAGLDDFILKLAARPLPEPAASLEPVFEEPLELRLQRSKSQ